MLCVCVCTQITVNITFATGSIPQIAFDQITNSTTPPPARRLLLGSQTLTASQYDTTMLGSVADSNFSDASGSGPAWAALTRPLTTPVSRSHTGQDKVTPVAALQPWYARTEQLLRQTDSLTCPADKPHTGPRSAAKQPGSGTPGASVEDSNSNSDDFLTETFARPLLSIRDRFVSSLEDLMLESDLNLDSNGDSWAGGASRHGSAVRRRLQASPACATALNLTGINATAAASLGIASLPTNSSTVCLQSVRVSTESNHHHLSSHTCKH